jgi:hypothetical protein
VLGDERLELGGELVVAAEGEPCADAALDRLEPQLLEACDLELGERHRGNTGERRATPERGGALEVVGGDVGRAGRERLTRLLDELLEPPRVELLVLELEHVPAGAGEERLREAVELAQSRDRVLDHLRRGRRRRDAPELVHDLVHRHQLVRVQEQIGEHRPLDRPAQRHGLSLVPDLELAESPELHCLSAAARLPANGRRVDGGADNPCVKRSGTRSSALHYRAVRPHRGSGFHG